MTAIGNGRPLAAAELDGQGLTWAAKSARKGSGSLTGRMVAWSMQTHLEWPIANSAESDRRRIV